MLLDPRNVCTRAHSGIYSMIRVDSNSFSSTCVILAQHLSFHQYMRTARTTPLIFPKSVLYFSRQQRTLLPSFCWPWTLQQCWRFTSKFQQHVRNTCCSTTAEVLLYWADASGWVRAWLTHFVHWWWLWVMAVRIIITRSAFAQYTSPGDEGFLSTAAAVY